MKIEMAKYRIKDICHLEKGQQIDTDLLDDSNRYRYVNGGIEASGNYGEYNTVGKTIMVSEGGASCGYVNYTEEPFWCGCHCYKLTGISVNPRYLFFALKANQTKIMGLRTGSAMPNIKKSLFEEFELSLSGNESEQIHVVEVLDKIGNLIDQRKSQIKYFDELLRARFVEMFENKGYPVCKLSEYTTKITDGTHKTPNYLSEGVVFISAINIVNGKLNFSDVKHISKEEYDEIQKRCELKKGDILLSKSGSLGAPVVVETDECLGLFESLAVLKGKWNLINNIFLCEQLKSQEIQRQFKAAGKGIAVKHLHLGVIANTNIIVSPIDLQNQFADFVHQVDKSKVAIQKSLDETQLLFDSLMQKYFG